MPILQTSPSDFTRYQRLNAQSTVTTNKPNQSSVAPIVTGVISSTVRASTVAAAVAPKTSVVSARRIVVNTKKRN